MPHPSQLTCPTCGHGLAPGDFLCVRCEVIVDPSALVDDDFEPPREPTLVRALLFPEATLERKPPPRPPPPPPQAGLKADRRSITRTRVFTIPADSEDVPTLLLGLDLKEQSLSSFEAYVLSLIDGRSNVEQIRMIAALSKIEIQSLLRSLLDRKLVQLTPPPKPAARQPRKAPAAPEDKPSPREVMLRAAPADRPAARAAPAASSGSAAAANPSPRPPPRRQLPQPVFNPLQKAIELERAGDFAGAIKVLELGIARSNDPAPLYNRLAIAVVKERRDLGAAEQLLQKALDLDPENEVYRQNLFKILSMSAALTGRHRMPKRR